MTTVDGSQGIGVRNRIRATECIRVAVGSGAGHRERVCGTNLVITTVIRIKARVKCVGEEGRTSIAQVECNFSATDKE